MRDDLPKNASLEISSPEKLATANVTTVNLAYEIAPPELYHFDYAIVRVVPRVERGEFLNVGVLVFCATQGFLGCRIELDHARLQAFAPLDIECVEANLESIKSVCVGGKAAGAIGEMAQRSRWHWLVAPRSTTIQISPVHAGLCHNLAGAVDNLFDKMVRRVEK